MKRVKLTTTMDKLILKTAKIQAIEEDRKLNELLEDACILYFKSKGIEIKTSKE